MKSLIESTQQLGRALMLPIAVLPVAGLLLRLGQPDLMNLAPVAAAGDAIFSNLGILFAIGVAVGLARENNGAAGLAAVVGFLVATKGAEVLIQVPPDLLIKGDLAIAKAAAERLRSQVQESTLDCGGATLSVTISGGLAMFPGDGVSWDQLFAEADKRLYASKRNGRNRITSS